MPFVAICPFCSKGKLLCPDHAVGWSSTCPNPQCGSSFTITRSLKAPSAGQRQPLGAPGGSEADATPPLINGAAVGSHDATTVPIAVRQTPGPARPEQAQFATPWNGLTALALFLGALALLGASLLKQWQVVLGVASAALLAGLIGVSLARYRQVGRKRAWLGPLAALLAMAVLGLPYLTEARWRPHPADVNPTQERVAIPINPLSGPSKSLEAGDWVDASRELILLSDFWLRVTDVSIARVNLRQGGSKITTDDRYLVIRLQLSNTGASRRIDYQSWADGPAGAAKHPAKLTDSADRALPQRAFGSATVIGQVSEGFLFPGKALDDVLVFEAPTGRFEHLRLVLPLAAIGGEGEIRLQVPRAMVQFR